jgi:small subunit ribosomal protein S5
MKTFHKKKFTKEVKEFDEEVIQIDRVTRVVKGGRRLRFRALVAIGDKKGRLGVGIGKASEVSVAIKKGIAVAKKSLITVPMDGSTIPHEHRIKFKSSKILIMPANSGTGVIAGGPIRKLASLAGISDIMSKSFGSSNKLNVTKAAFQAFQELKSRPGQKKQQVVEIKKTAPKNEKEEKSAENKTASKAVKPLVKKETAEIKPKAVKKKSE